MYEGQAANGSPYWLRVGELLSFADCLIFTEHSVTQLKGRLYASSKETNQPSDYAGSLSKAALFLKNIKTL